MATAYELLLEIPGNGEVDLINAQIIKDKLFPTPIITDNNEILFETNNEIAGLIEAERISDTPRIFSRQNTLRAVTWDFFAERDFMHVYLITNKHHQDHESFEGRRRTSVMIRPNHLNLGSVNVVHKEKQKAFDTINKAILIGTGNVCEFRIESNHFYLPPVLFALMSSRIRYKKTNSYRRCLMVRNIAPQSSGIDLLVGMRQYNT